MNKRIIQALFFPFLMVLLLGVLACEKKYSGKVIDADTKEPIEGAVVVATWHEETATVAGPSMRFKDVKETLTDKNGRWTMEGHKGNCYDTIPRLLNFIGIPCTQKPTFIVFKPGYCSWSFNALSIDVCEEKSKGYNYTYSNNIAEIIELPKLTEREDRRKALHVDPGWDAEDEKIPNFIRLRKEERRYLGLDAT